MTTMLHEITMHQRDPAGETSLEVIYAVENDLSRADFSDVLHRSGLGERRPLTDTDRLEAMLKHANLIVTARDVRDERLLGVARSLTDFAFCCYLSCLAVDREIQRAGIGRALIRFTREQIGPKTQLLLLAAPAAREYYGHIGFRYVENAWSLDGRPDGTERDVAP